MSDHVCFCRVSRNIFKKKKIKKKYPVLEDDSHPTNRNHFTMIPPEFHRNQIFFIQVASKKNVMKVFYLNKNSTAIKLVQYSIRHSDLPIITIPSSLIEPNLSIRSLFFGEGVIKLRIEVNTKTWEKRISFYYPSLPTVLQRKAKNQPFVFLKLCFWQRKILYKLEFSLEFERKTQKFRSIYNRFMLNI